MLIHLYIYPRFKCLPSTLTQKWCEIWKFFFISLFSRHHMFRLLSTPAWSIHRRFGLHCMHCTLKYLSKKHTLDHKVQYTKLLKSCITLSFQYILSQCRHHSSAIFLATSEHFHLGWQTLNASHSHRKSLKLK